MNIVSSNFVFMPCILYLSLKYIILLHFQYTVKVWVYDPHCVHFVFFNDGKSVSCTETKIDESFAHRPICVLL